MGGRVFVDTNVLVYAHDTSAGVKHEKARALVERLWQERSGAVSTQVLQELYVSLRRTAGRPLASEEARVSFWDALVIQSSRTCGAAEVLYFRGGSPRRGRADRTGPRGARPRGTALDGVREAGVGSARLDVTPRGCHDHLPALARCSRRPGWS